VSKVVGTCLLQFTHLMVLESTTRVAAARVQERAMIKIRMHS
jgi:hypothetical protein